MTPTATTPALSSTTPAPTSVRAYAPQTGSPPWPLVEVPREHLAAALALMPDSELYIYINLDAVSQRPGLQEHVEFQLSHFVTSDEIPFAEELLASIGADALIFSFPLYRFDWAILLQGDFTRLADALRVSAESGGGLSVSVVDTHRDIDIYALVRNKSSGYRSEIYLAVLDAGDLAASPDPDALRDVMERHAEGGQLPEGLVSLVENWGLGDFLEAFLVEAIGPQESPLVEATVFAFRADLADGSNSTLRELRQFDDEEHAVAAAAWLNEQAEPFWREIGWGDSVSIEEWLHRGTTVYAEVTLPDEDLPYLVQGN